MTIEQTIKVGDNPRVHVRSDNHPGFTRCGLEEAMPFMKFRATLEAVTCPFCARPEPALRRSA
jgi:hypothetical protein